MRAVKVHETAGFGDARVAGRWKGQSLKPNQFPFFFEIFRYWYGPQLASKFIAEFRRHGGSIPFEAIYRRMRDSGVEWWDANAILDAIAHPSPVGFGFAGKKNLASLGQLGFSKTWKRRIRKFYKIALPVAAVVGAAFIPGVGDALLKVGKSIGGSIFKAFGGTSFGSQKAGAAESAVTDVLSQQSEEEVVSESSLVEKVMGAVVEATGIKPDEVLRNLVQQAIQKNVPEEFQTQTTETVDQVVDTYVDDEGKVVGQESHLYGQSGERYQPPQKENGVTIKTEHLLIGGGFLLMFMMMQMQRY
jgi:hypothetical protein